MTFEEAWQRVALAGRELGSGPAAAARRLLDVDDVRTWLTGRGVSDPRADTLALGVAVGLVMAEQPDALRVLDEIKREWRRNP